MFDDFDPRYFVLFLLVILGNALSGGGFWLLLCSGLLPLPFQPPHSARKRPDTH